MSITKDLIIEIGCRDWDKVEQALRKCQPLIEAAPDLVEALKGMMSLWSDIKERNPILTIKDNGFNGSTDYVGRARQAIKKAGG